ncbi:MAG: hypothetical protein L0I76_07295 [Pseudonocardia sp.]|nr:hypothetical protein [Pseudonocardia sp.]
MDPTVLDTEAFAPLPRSQWQQAAQSRAGVQIVTTPGALIRLRDTGTASSTAPTVALLTDAPHTLECYDDLVAELGPEVRTVIIEPPGFGFSWVTDPEAFSYPGATEAILAALGQLGITGAVLGGACVYGNAAFIGTGCGARLGWRR